MEARRGELDFPRVNMTTYGGRAFAYAGPTSWNSLPDSLKNINLTLQTSKCHLVYFSACEVSYKKALYKSTVRLLLLKQRMIKNKEEKGSGREKG